MRKIALLGLLVLAGAWTGACTYVGMGGNILGSTCYGLTNAACFQAAADLSNPSNGANLTYAGGQGASVLPNGNYVTGENDFNWNQCEVGALVCKEVEQVAGGFGRYWNTLYYGGEETAFADGRVLMVIRDDNGNGYVGADTYGPNGIFANGYTTGVYTTWTVNTPIVPCGIRNYDGALYGIFATGDVPTYRRTPVGVTSVGWDILPGVDRHENNDAHVHNATINDGLAQLSLAQRLALLNQIDASAIETVQTPVGPVENLQLQITGINYEGETYRPDIPVGIEIANLRNIAFNPYAAEFKPVAAWLAPRMQASLDGGDHQPAISFEINGGMLNLQFSDLFPKSKWMVGPAMVDRLIDWSGSATPGGDSGRTR